MVLLRSVMTCWLGAVWCLVGWRLCGEGRTGSIGVKCGSAGDVEQDASRIRRIRMAIAVINQMRRVASGSAPHYLIWDRTRRVGSCPTAPPARGSKGDTSVHVRTTMREHRFQQAVETQQGVGSADVRDTKSSRLSVIAGARRILEEIVWSLKRCRKDKRP